MCFKPDAESINIKHPMNKCFLQNHYTAIWHFRYFNHTNCMTAKNSHCKTPDITSLIVPFTNIKDSLFRRSTFTVNSFLKWILRLSDVSWAFLDSCYKEEENRNFKCLDHASQNMWQDACGSKNCLIVLQKSVWIHFVIIVINKSNCAASLLSYVSSC